MPKSACYTLTWLSSNQAYELYEGQEDDLLALAPGSPAWLVWVSQVSSFAFHGQNGSCTVRKERKLRGGGYWYAYARVAGNLTKRYLGRDTDLTLARLEQVAQAFRLDPPAVVHQKEARASSPPQPAVPTPREANGLLADSLSQAHDWSSAGPQPQRDSGVGGRQAEHESGAGLQAEVSALIAGLPHHPLPSLPVEVVLTLLINDLQARMTVDHEHVVLVLDNYHVITNGSIHFALSFLLEHRPPQLHLVLATRQDPPLPLARLRGQGDLLELRAAELRFTHEETATYLVEVMGLPLSVEECTLLQARTEGWITGLQLAAFSLSHHDDQAGFIAAFSGSHHYVMDYLLEEVLSRQSQAVQDFLLHTSLLERLSASLCDAVRAQGGSQALLDFLERANLFLVPLDDEGQWYRYHHLFVEVLRQRLQQTATTLVADLHLRASRWYEQHGFFSEAVSHALAASAFGEAARLIEQCLWTFFVLGNQMQTLCGWLHSLPESLVLAHPSLRLIDALALMYTNH